MAMQTGLRRVAWYLEEEVCTSGAGVGEGARRKQDEGSSTGHVWWSLVASARVT